MPRGQEFSGTWGQLKKPKALRGKKNTLHLPVHFFALCWQDAIIVSEHFCFSTIITLKIIGDIGWRKPRQVWKFDNSSWKALQKAAGQLYAFSRREITKWLFFCQSYNHFENQSPQMKPQADKVKHTGCNLKCKLSMVTVVVGLCVLSSLWVRSANSSELNSDLRDVGGVAV